MNILEDLKNDQDYDVFQLSEYKVGYNQALEDIQDKYDSLCPKPSEFGDRNATECWALYPIRTLDYSYLRFNKGENSKGTEFAIDKIPLGLDYRLCVWSIEDAKRIWGKEE